MIIARLKNGIKELRTVLREKDSLGFVFLASRLFPDSIIRVRVAVMARAHSIRRLRSPSNVVYRRLLLDQLPPVISLPVLKGYTAEALHTEFKQNLVEGRDGFVAEIGGKVVGYTWATYGRYYVPRIRFNLTLKADEACVCQSYVAPGHRYSGAYAGLANFMFQYLRERGVRWFVGYTWSTNRHSIRTHKRMGFEIAGWVMLVESPFGALQLRRLWSEGMKLRWQFLGRRTEATAARQRSGPTGTENLRQKLRWQG